MDNKFQFFDKTGQRGVPTKYFVTPGQQVETSYCPGENRTSGHFNLSELCLLVNGLLLVSFTYSALSLSFLRELTFLFISTISAPQCLPSSQSECTSLYTSLITLIVT